MITKTLRSLLTRKAPAPTKRLGATDTVAIPRGDRSQMTSDPALTRSLPSVTGPSRRVLVIADKDSISLPDPLPDVDAVLSLGDIRDPGLVRVMTVVGENQPSLPPLLYVRGNHDPDASFPMAREADPDSDKTMAKVWGFPRPRDFPWTTKDVHACAYEWSGMTVGGFGGSPRYRTGLPHGYDDEEVRAALEDFPSVDIFLAHNSPEGIHDAPDPAHQGFTAFLDYIERACPRFFLHGHQHVNAVTRVKDTWVVGVYGSRILDIPFDILPDLKDGASRANR